MDVHSFCVLPLTHALTRAGTSPPTESGEFVNLEESTEEADGLEPFELGPSGHMLDFGFSLGFFLKVFGKSPTSCLVDRFICHCIPPFEG